MDVSIPDDDTILGDIDVWFDAFERGDFAVAWEVQQAAIQAQLIASCQRFNMLVPDASLD